MQQKLHKKACKQAFKKFLIFDPGEENSKLLTELDRESKEVARLTLVESEVQRLKVELDEVQAKLKSTVLELGKTQARNKTMERHEQVSDGPTCSNSFQSSLKFGICLQPVSLYEAKQNLW